jgi:RNase P subunit RPR2
MTRDEVIAAWSHQADYMNQWETLGEDEKLEWAMKLKREACAKVCDELIAPALYGDADKSMWDVTCMDCADAIRNRGQA